MSLLYFSDMKGNPWASMTDTLGPPFGVKCCMSYSEAQVSRDIVLDRKPSWLALENDWWQLVSNGKWASLGEGCVCAPPLSALSWKSAMSSLTPKGTLWVWMMSWGWEQTAQVPEQQHCLPSVFMSLLGATKMLSGLYKCVPLLINLLF